MLAVRAASIWLFCAFLLTGACFIHPVEYDNTVSRFLAVGSLVDRGTLHIDRDHERTVDKSFFGGHYYSNKGIGTLVVGAPAYWALRKTLLPRIEGLPEPLLLYEEHARYLLRLLTTTLAFAVLAVLMFRLLADWASPRGAFWATLAYGLGSIASLHATLFSGHQLTAFWLFAAFFLLRRSRGAAGALGAGLAAGLAVLTEFPAVFPALALAGYAVASPRRGAPARAAFLAGAAACAALLGAYNRACFGSAFTLSYEVLGNPTFRDYTARGVLGFTAPSPAALAALLASPARGLGFIMPVFLYALPGLAAMRRLPGARVEAAGIAATFAGMAVLFSGYAGWHGGWTYGPRYLVLLLPFLAVPLAWGARPGIAFFALLGLSAAQVLAAQLGMPHAPPSIRNPLVELVLPLWRDGYSSTTLFGLGGGEGAALIAALAAVGAVAGRAALRGLPAAAVLAPKPAERWFAAWGGCVVLALALARTPDPRRPACFRALLLTHAARTTGAEPLALSAERAWSEAGGADACGAVLR
ncbi:MAG: hypothetical protein HY553_06470 [Elusimicrobia bacterium]|nr:hypothetical protein [Elusimicrobiota bacterium]